MKNVGLRYEGWGFVFGGTGLRQGVPIERNSPNVHDPFCSNLLPNGHRIRVKDNGLNPLILKLESRNQILFLR